MKVTRKEANESRDAFAEQFRPVAFGDPSEGEPACWYFDERPTEASVRALVPSAGWQFHVWAVIRKDGANQTWVMPGLARLSAIAHIVTEIPWLPGAQPDICIAARDDDEESDAPGEPP